jgi:hypothetical protein
VTSTEYIIGLQVIVTLVFLVTFRHLSPTDHIAGKGDKAGAKMPWFKRDQIQFWVIVLGLFLSTTAEFSVSDWGAILSRDEFKVHAPWYLIPFIIFQAGIVLSRLSLNKMSAKFGEARTVRMGAIVASVVWGVSLQLIAHLSHSHQVLTLALLVIGFFVAGWGVGPVWPAFLSSATRSHYPVPNVLSRLFSFLSLAFVFGPGVIGSLSKVVALSTAMMVPVVALFVVGLLTQQSLERH